MLTTLTIQPATTPDIPSLEALLNAAYRGEGSKQGWTTEADLLAGDIRTDEADLAQKLADPNAVILKCTGPDDRIMGCVFLRKDGGRLYLGMLSVSPAAEGQGIGKLLLLKAEEHARAVGCDRIYMQVISHRPELDAWYLRNGYAHTGERRPFDVDPKYGVPTMPLEFAILEKML